VTGGVVGVRDRPAIRPGDAHQAVQVVVGVARDAAPVSDRLALAVGSVGVRDRLAVEGVGPRQPVQCVVGKGVDVAVGQPVVDEIPHRVVTEGLERAVGPGLADTAAQRVVREAGRVAVGVGDGEQVAGHATAEEAAHGQVTSAPAGSAARGGAGVGIGDEAAWVVKVQGLFCLLAPQPFSKPWEPPR